MKQLDEDSGKSYYYHEQTGATAWEKPEEFNDPTVHDAVAQCANKSAWVQKHDDASGEDYFFNEETGETSWEQPEAFSSSVSSSGGDQVVPLAGGSALP